MSENLKNPHLIGKVHSSQGVRGAIFIILNVEEAAWVSKWKTLFLSSKPDTQDFISYPIRKKAAHSKQGRKGYIVELENINDRDVAESLVHKAVWISQDFLISQKGETIYLREILGFQVVDEQRGDLGPIVEFSSNGPQDLLCIDYKGKTFEVPFVKPFIKKLDFAGKKIHMDIPLGLLEDIE